MSTVTKYFFAILFFLSAISTNTFAQASRPDPLSVSEESKTKAALYILKIINASYSKEGYNSIKGNLYGEDNGLKIYQVKNMSGLETTGQYILVKGENDISYQGYFGGEVGLQIIGAIEKVLPGMPVTDGYSFGFEKLPTDNYEGSFKYIITDNGEKVAIYNYDSAKNKGIFIMKQRAVTVN